MFDATDAADHVLVWAHLSSVFTSVQTDIAYPIDGGFNGIEDRSDVLYSNERFACQDYLPWLGGNPLPTPGGNP